MQKYFRPRWAQSPEEALFCAEAHIIQLETELAAAEARAEQAEANAVKPVHGKSYCNAINCDGGAYKTRSGYCKHPQCGVMDVLEWLKTNGHIREEE